MGCVGSKKSNEANVVLLRRELKMLLLGAGESGKSTIAKEMRILHTRDGFSERDRLELRDIVYANASQSLAAILRAMDALHIAYADRSRLCDRDEFFDLIKEDDIMQVTLELGVVMKRLWADDGVQACVKRSREYELNDSAEYYLNSLDRLFAEDYIPTLDDVLRMRVKTTGVVQTQFVYEEVLFKLVDVGGQRSERSKWTNYFQDVHALVFCVALPDYDLVLHDDETMNRLHESLKLFGIICNSDYFANTTLILILNKMDIFAEKIKRSPLTVCFPEYKGANTYDEAAPYIKGKFEEMNRRRDQNGKPKNIYTYFTCATDTTNIRDVFSSALDTIIRERAHEQSPNSIQSSTGKKMPKDKKKAAIGE